MMRYFPCLLICGIVSVSAPALAGPAPKQLYNKSVAIHWVESVLQKAPDGSSRNPQINTQRTAYVSSAGRLFVKGSRNINNLTSRLHDGKPVEDLKLR